ncbi:MAG: lipid-A-disaccharide synthase [Campylobacterota bacterium]|nr:lipid-A-disaccharide synthase [Campylobacterota bacterium]
MKLLVSALEHSANVHLEALQKELPEDVEFIGIFDKKLGNPMIDLSSLAIMGIVDAVKKLPFFFKLASQMLILAKEADKVLLIDSSGFNLPLAKKLKKKYPNKEIIYYILPQAWVWKRKRIAVINKTIDVIASILPFEKSYYPQDSHIQYVGHPLLDEIHVFKESLSTSNKIAFMPGSRKGEVTRLMPIFHELIKQLPDKELLLIIPPHFTTQQVHELYGDTTKFTITNDAHQSLYDAEFAFICSGTATLEAALIGTPFVLSYKAKPIDYAIGSRIVKLDYVGLGNIMFSKMCNKQLHEEFLQEEVTVENIYRAYNQMDREKFLNSAKELRGYLGHGSSETVAKLIQS